MERFHTITSASQNTSQFKSPIRSPVDVGSSSTSKRRRKQKEKEKEKEEKEEIAAQLEVVRREISQAEARCQVLIRRAKRDRNDAMRRNSERWQQRERELKEKHEQEKSEWMEEVEHHETVRDGNKEREN